MRLLMVERLTLKARARRSLLTPLFDCPAQHVLLLYGREPVQAVIVGVGFEILRDQAGRCVVTQLLQGEDPQVAVTLIPTRLARSRWLMSGFSRKTRRVRRWRSSWASDRRLAMVWGEGSFAGATKLPHGG